MSRSKGHASATEPAHGAVGRLSAELPCAMRRGLHWSSERALTCRALRFRGPFLVPLHRWSLVAVVLVVTRLAGLPVLAAPMVTHPGAKVTHSVTHFPPFYHPSDLHHFRASVIDG